MGRVETTTMKLTTVVEIGLTALLLTAGAAAAIPGNAPVDAGTDDEVETAGPAEQPAENVRGPPTDMPAQVPDFDTDIHSLIDDFLSGDIDGNLGERISEVTPSEDAGPTTDTES